jgi:hypothetical protein
VPRSYEKRHARLGSPSQTRFAARANEATGLRKLSLVGMTGCGTELPSGWGEFFRPQKAKRLCGLFTRAGPLRPLFGIDEITAKASAEFFCVRALFGEAEDNHVYVVAAE